MTVGQPIHLTEVIKGQIYLGNLAAALSAEQKAKLGITHVVSVCPDNSTISSNHLVIPIQDSEHDDLLIHLPVICEFIEGALKEHGRVLVHCVMGISRSASAIAAYLMKSKRMSVADAIRYLKQLRPIVHPNYGFIKQLHVFEDCAYQPSQLHPRYLSWKRRHKQDVKTYLNTLEDTFPLVHDKVLLTSDYPKDIVQAQSFVLDLGITKIISIDPAELPSNQSEPLNFTQHERFHVTDSSSTHFDTLESVCHSIHEVMNKGGQALVYCQNETKLCVAACAFLMSVQGLSMKQAVSRVEDVVPLFDKSPSFMRMLQAYDSARTSPKKVSPCRNQKRSSIVRIEFGKGSMIDLGVVPTGSLLG